MNEQEAMNAIRLHPRVVTLRTAQGSWYGEGVLICYTMEPSVIVEYPDGTQKSWLMRLTEDGAE